MIITDANFPTPQEARDFPETLLEDVWYEIIASCCEWPVMYETDNLSEQEINYLLSVLKQKGYRAEYIKDRDVMKIDAVKKAEKKGRLNGIEERLIASSKEVMSDGDKERPTICSDRRACVGRNSAR